VATLELCDLCAGKVKTRMAHIDLRGQLKNFIGPLPPAPEGFKYKDDADKNSYGKVTYKKVWDEYGRIISEAKFIDPPKRYKEVSINYDLCENCFDKFVLMLESIKKQYHLEATEINLIEDNSFKYKNPFLGLLGEPEDDD